MAKVEDLDISIDGFDPEELFGAQRQRRSRDNYADMRKSSFTAAAPAMPLPDDLTIDSDSDTEYKAKATAAPKTKEAAPAPATNVQDQSRAKAKKKVRTRSARPNIFVRFFTDERLRAFLGITLLLSCVFILVAVVSHVKNGSHDQSIVINSTFEQMATDGNVRNAGGGFGAWLSHVLLCDALGLGSLVFIVYTWMLGLALLGWTKIHFWSLTFKTLLVSITISIVLGLITFNYESVMIWGGTHGYYVNKFLHAHTTWIGAMLISALLILAVACVYLNELHVIWKKWKESNYRAKLQEELHREKRRKLQTISDPAEGAEKSTNKTGQEGGIEVVMATDDNNAKTYNEGFNISPKVTEKTNTPPMQDITVDDSAVAEFGFTIDERKPSPRTQSQYTHDSNANGAKAAPASNVQDSEQAFSIVAPKIEVADKIATHVDVPKTAIAPNAQSTLYDHRAELSRFSFPDITLLKERKSGAVIDMAEQQANKDRIVKTLSDYNIPISRIEATVGPTVTLYEIVPAEGVRISQIKRLEDDIALSLSALGIRIIAPIPGKGTVGIEVPNSDPQTVSMRAVITSKKYQDCEMALPMAMGATISNDIFIADLAKMPHLLVAGATGMGKSVGLNAIIASLLYKKHPSELKFVLIDPKMVEFSLYSKLERHYLAMLPGEDDPIITDPSKVIQTLNSLCVEMDDRYNLLRKANVRSLEEYNKKFTERRLLPSEGHKYLPYIVVIVDEFADLIMTAGKEVETPIARIAQKARAVGIHMIIATQRPSTNVITGIIKANFPGRIAFRVIQMVDSKTILDSPGANQLIGRGDMLFSHNGSMDRVQCAFISTEEVEAITEWIDNQVGFEHAYYLPEYHPEGADGAIAGAGSDRDALFDEAARFVVQRQIGSTSSLQRQFNIGYNRAGRLMDQMEAAGIIGPVNGSKPRAILVDSMTLEHILQQ